MRSTAALPLAVFTAANLAFTAAAAPKENWNAWVDGGAFYNNNDDGRGEVTLWTPLYQSPASITFLDLRGKLFDAGETEGNIALGYREQRDGWNLGVWGGLDLRRSSLDSTFTQISGGVEVISQDFDLHLNGYLPLDDSDIISTSSVSVGGAPTLLLSGNSILLQTGVNTTTTIVEKLAFGGVDAEIGARIPLEEWGTDPGKLDLRLYAGGFYFENDAAPDSISGPKARLELRINDVIDAIPGSRLTIESEYTNDDVRGDRAEVGLRLRVPLNGGDGPALASAPLLDQRMSEGLRRDTDVVATPQTTSTTINTLTTEAVKDDLTNVTLSKVAYVDATTGITSVSAAQGANTLLIAQGDTGTIVEDVTLMDGQTLIGGGASISLRGVTTNTQISFTATGQRPTIQNATANSNIAAIIVGSDTQVKGLNLDVSTGVNGIIAKSSIANTLVSNTVIAFNTIDSASGFAISAYSADGIAINGNQVLTSQAGLWLDDVSNSTISLNNLQADAGIGLTSSSNTTYSNLTLYLNTITTQSLVGTLGIAMSNLGAGTAISITDNIIAAYSPFIAFGSASTGSMDGNSFTAPDAGTVITMLGSGNSFAGSNNTSINASATLCAVAGNPGTNIQFVGGATCP